MRVVGAVVAVAIPFVGIAAPPVASAQCPDPAVNGVECDAQTDGVDDGLQRGRIRVPGGLREDGPPTPPSAGFTVVTWTGTDCIDIGVPGPDGSRIEQHCGGSARFDNPGVPGVWGAQPIVGDADSVVCDMHPFKDPELSFRAEFTPGDDRGPNCTFQSFAVHHLTPNDLT